MIQHFTNTRELNILRGKQVHCSASQLQA